MFSSKHFRKISLLIIILMIFLSIQTFAQPDTKIIRTIVYHAINKFPDRDIWNTKMSADGSKIIFTDHATKVYTINADGTNLKTIHDFEQNVLPLLDISANGSKVVMQPRYGGYYYGFIISNSDGSQKVAVNKLPTVHST